MRLNRKQNIRFLSVIGLLLFFLPFFQTCSDEIIRSNSSFIKSYSLAKTEKEKEIAFQGAKKDFSISGVDLAMTFEKEFIGFSIMLVCSITLLICFFRGHYGQIFITLINLVTTFIMISFLFMFSVVSEIRYGLYLYFLNSIYLFFLVYKEQSESNYK